MARVDAFNKGKFVKDDEYYTRYEDIQNELNNYKTDFKNKVVLCNCDDPYESNFCKFFLKNFNYLELKKLICTSYSGSPVICTQLSLFDDMDEPIVAKNGYVIEIESMPMKNGRGITDQDILDLLTSKKRGVKKLKSNGDFRSKECMEYMLEADIVVTNPPFSLFSEYLILLINHNKKFLIIGRETSITLKNVFESIQSNKVWYGYTHAKEFLKPDGTIKSFGNVVWYTNLDVSKRHEKLVCYRSYTDDGYEHYYNYDGINIKEISEIPMNYYGDMGVPMSYLDKWNPDEFEIVGLGQSVLKKYLHKTTADSTRIEFIDCNTGEVVYSMPYNVQERKRGNQLRINNNGKPGKVPFGRLVIRRKHNED